VFNFVIDKYHKKNRS